MTQRLIKRWKSWCKTSYRTVFLGKWIPQMRNRINIPKNMFSTKRIAKELFQRKRRTEGNILTNKTLSFCIKGSFFNSDNALGYDLVFREEKVKVEISRAFISNIILNSGCAWSVYWRLLFLFVIIILPTKLFPGEDDPPLRGPDWRQLPRAHHQHNQTDRNIQLGRSVPCQGCFHGHASINLTDVIIWKCSKQMMMAKFW